MPRIFHALETNRRTGRFLGVPFFDPPINPTLLFDPWAYLFGPLYFLGRGIWRKSLTLLLLGAVCYAPSLFPENAALRQALVEEYATPHLILTALSVLFTLLFCMGRRLTAVFTGILFAAVFIASQPMVAYLNMGTFSAFTWLNSSLIWTALGRGLLFSLLGKKTLLSAALAALSAALFVLGLPLTLGLSDLPSLAYPIFCGMAGTYDLYRTRRLGEKFWW